MSRNIYLLCLMVSYFAFAQNGIAQKLSPVAQEIQNAKTAGLPFQSTTLFEPLQGAAVTDLAKRNLKVDNAVYFNFEKSAAFNQRTQSSTSLSLDIPGNARSPQMTLDLIEVDIYSGDFITNVDHVPGKHYRGVIKGEKNSLASISIFENEVIGFIQKKGETLTLGKVKGAKKLHVLYNEFEQGWGMDLQCNTDDQKISFDPAEIKNASATRSPDDCIRERFDVDESITNLLGGVTQATNYATGLFNNHKTLFTNDGINVVLSELKIWSNADPAPFVLDEYNTLDSYRAETEEYNGDVAYLGFYQDGWGGGVASAIGGICPSNVDDSKAIGGHYGNYNDVPTYSHDVMIISHELGHIFGARHTHACVWNGNNTAIDGCAGFTEGGCGVPGNAPNAGTIMSYCNQNDFNEGFHPQVAEAIRDYIASCTCTNPCGGNQPTCEDGIQNGDETGVDCGGTCPPCETAPTCDDGIQNGDETGVDCGGTCPPCETAPTCDDGIQNGDETGVDCGGTCPPCETPPTCDDGIQNGNETGVDCGGTCPPCETAPTCDDGIQNGDETGVDCGGTCPSCDPDECTENSVVLSLTLDNYPKETSWDIKDENGAVVASSNGHYGNQPNGATVVEEACLIDGCYTFNIYDHFGDGICCEYGSGAYTLVDGPGNVLVQGAVFGSVESTDFCVSGTTPPEVEYCASTGENVGFEWIERIQFGGIDNTSGSNDGYGDFTNLSTTVTAGSSVDVTLTPGFSGSTYDEYWRIWIDFNQDGDFDDVGELLGEGNGAGTLSGTLSIPSSASTGTTRMRVAMQYFAYPESCGNFFYGEVEDYMIIIGAGFNTSQIDASTRPAKVSGRGLPAANGLALSPNPAVDKVQIDYTAREKGDLQITLMTATGKAVIVKKKWADTGRNTYDLNTEALPAGVYMLKLNRGKHQVTKRLTVVK